MDSRRYQVIFSGVTAEGHDPESVKKKFAGLFKLDPQRVVQYFSGSPVTIKKGLTREAADQYFNRMEQIGAISSIEPMEEAQATPAGNPHQAQNDKEAFACPKCGFQQAPADECARCGIIIRKFKKDLEQKAQAEELPIRATRKKKRKPPTLLQQFMGSMIYPFAGNGLILMVTGTLFFLFWNVMMFLPFIGIVAAVFASGYLTSFVFKIIGGSADGEDKPPDWPDFSDMWIDIVKPFFLMLSCSVMSYIPLIALLWLRFVDKVEISLVFFGVAIAWSIF